MAQIFNKLKKKRKDHRNSVYSMVSSSDLTAGSCEVWVDLPDSIKFDSSLEPFKRLYEQQHGILNIPEITITNDGVTTTLDTSGADRSLSPVVEQFELTPINTGPVDSRPNEDTALDGEGNAVGSEKNSKYQTILKVIKLSALVGFWVVLTIALVMNQEKTDVVLHTAVQPGQVKEYDLPSSSGKFLLGVKLNGPFFQARVKHPSHVLKVWLHRESDSYDQDSKIWLVNLQPDEKLDFAPSITESKTLILERNETAEELDILLANDTLGLGENEGVKVTLLMSSTSYDIVPLTLTYHLNALSERDGLIYSIILLLILYFMVVFEVVNRTIAALFCSSMGIAVLALCGARPSLPELVSWLDVETLLLLFSMMILVAILGETGLFDYLAVVAYEVTGGHTWPLINCLCFVTAFFSTFLDNVTTVLLMTPVTIRLCEVMYLNPVPVLMCMVIFSNVGGAATPVGDPPNVIIASYPAMLIKNINFTTFTLHMGCGIIAVCFQTYLQLRYIFRDIKKLRNAEPSEILELRQVIAVWQRAAASLSSYSRDEDLVRRALEKKVSKLNRTLLRREAGGGSSRRDPNFCATLAQMKEKYKIRDKGLLIKSTISVMFVVVVFFLHAIPQLQSLSLGWTALLGALLLLILADRRDLEPVLARVEWSTLLFFAALFVLMEILSKLGLIRWIGEITESIILMVDKDSQLAVAILLVLWVSGIASAFVDNIPLTTMMVRVVGELASPAGLNLPLAPLAWALSFGACLGGNGTLIGASANVVCAGVAEQHGYRFTFIQYLKIGFPVMIGNLLVASVYLLVCHVLFTWH